MATDVMDLPPQNLDAEQCVLGSLLLDNRAFDECSEVLLAEHFYFDINRTIYEAICGMVAESQPIDIVTLAENLSATGKLDDIGGPPYLLQLLEKVPHAAHAKYYAEIVSSRWEQRELRGICQESLSAMRDPGADTTELVENHERSLFAMADKRCAAASILSIADILPDTMSQMDFRIAGGSSGAVPSGFPNLDEYTAGFHKKNLTILAARPSVGKTSFVCNVADWFVRRAACPTAFFCLEQSRGELAERFLSIRTHINGHSIRKGLVTREERLALAEASRELSMLPLWIDDTASRSVAQISSICRRLKRKSGLGAVIIDYLQLIEPESKKDMREVQVSTISRRLKQLAKDLDVPVIALSQMNRGVVNREDKRPRLCDLRESGAIEQDADMVMFLHRPDAYDPEDQPGFAELILAKNRSGPQCIINLEWKKETMQFVDGQSAMQDQLSGAGF